MAGLEPILGPGLRVVFCGTAVAERSATRGHYYAGRGNEFWPLLAESRLSVVRLGPDDDGNLPSHGLGLTDLAPGVTQSHDRGLRYDVPTLVRAMEQWHPRFLAFTSKKGRGRQRSGSVTRRRVSAFSPGGLVRLAFSCCRAPAVRTGGRPMTGARRGWSGGPNWERWPGCFAVESSAAAAS